MAADPVPPILYGFAGVTRPLLFHEDTLMPTKPTREHRRLAEAVAKDFANQQAQANEPTNMVLAFLSAARGDVAKALALAEQSAKIEKQLKRGSYVKH